MVTNKWPGEKAACYGPDKPCATWIQQKPKPLTRLKLWTPLPGAEKQGRVPWVICPSCPCWAAAALADGAWGLEPHCSCRFQLISGTNTGGVSVTPAQLWKQLLPLSTALSCSGLSSLGTTADTAGPSAHGTWWAIAGD